MNHILIDVAASKLIASQVVYHSIFRESHSPVSMMCVFWAAPTYFDCSLPSIINWNLFQYFPLNIDNILSADATRSQMMNVLCEFAAFNWNIWKIKISFAVLLWTSKLRFQPNMSEIHVMNLIKMWKIKRRNAIKKCLTFHRQIVPSRDVWLICCSFFTQLFLSSQKSIQRLRTKYLYGNSALESIVCIRQLKQQHSFA